ncbi:hypothetical protein QJS10_CPA10g00202 [Acorus calamus]|uniref:Uncharacterized protein n=1 Tax=Acorus calamus TaxID=4465 RepID=A0AAV9DX81_ACOCL|nr:hypothetical protein QJS10_CPA10g00202 [Acorus calamus]
MKGYMLVGDIKLMLWRFMSSKAAVGSSMDCAFAFGSEGVNALLYVTQLQGLAEGSSPISPEKGAASSLTPRTSECPNCSTTPANVITSST